jgi:hypothetical protein
MFITPQNKHLVMDVIMTLDDFNPQKNKVDMQRQMIGKHMLFFLDEDLKMKSHQHKPM